MTLQEPFTQVGREIESLCRKAIYDFKLLEDEGPLAVALSGGKDSLTLLTMLKKILGRGVPDRPLYAIHVSGAFSCGASISESFLKDFCQKLAIPLYIESTDQKLEELECYSCSRTRRKLIFDRAKELGAKTIAFGHHRDDLCETLLLNLLHKAEFAGLLPKTPMFHYGVTIVRPLIYVSEQAIREFSKLQGFARITCQCPVGQNSKRKKTKDLLDRIEELFPDVRGNLAKASHQYGSQKASTP